MTTEELRVMPLSKQIETILRDAPSLEWAWGAMVEERIIHKAAALENSIVNLKAEVEALPTTYQSGNMKFPDVFKNEVLKLISKIQTASKEQI